MASALRGKCLYLLSKSNTNIELPATADKFIPRYGKFFAREKKRPNKREIRTRRRGLTFSIDILMICIVSNIYPVYRTGITKLCVVLLHTFRENERRITIRSLEKSMTTTSVSPTALERVNGLRFIGLGRS